MVLEQWDKQIKKLNLGLYLALYTKINLIYILKPSRTKIVILLE